MLKVGVDFVSGWFRVHVGWIRVCLVVICGWFEMHLWLVFGLLRVGFGKLRVCSGGVGGWFMVVWGGFSFKIKWFGLGFTSG